MEEVVWSDEETESKNTNCKIHPTGLALCKPNPKEFQRVIVKICKKKEKIDDVFSDENKFIEPCLIENKLDENLVNRAYVLERLNKMINGQEVDEFKLKPSSMPLPPASPEENFFDENISEEKQEEKEKEPENEKEKEKEKENEKKKKKEKEKEEEEEEKEEENEEEKTKEKAKEKVVKKQKNYQVEISKHYMTNRRLFIQKLEPLFNKYADEISKLDDASVSCESRSTEEFETLVHQKVVRDYINIYTPYRGLLIYHGLGSGKTCTSIAIAEGMKTDKRIIVMTPASLKTNFFSELKKCGDDIYRKNQYWTKINVKEDKDAEELFNLTGIDIDYIKKKGIWLGKKTLEKDEKKFADLLPKEQKEVDEQLDLMIRKKYEDINYNGLTRPILNRIVNKMHKAEEQEEGLIKKKSKNPFNNAVVIIDEAHNFVSRIVNKINKPDSISYELYDYLMSAENAKLIFLTGTPIINYSNEIAILFNMLRGYIKTWTFYLKQPTTEDSIFKIFKKNGLNTYDYLGYSGQKITITRNPYGFINVYEKKNNNYSGVIFNESGNISDEEFEKKVIEVLKKDNIDVFVTKTNKTFYKSLPDDKEEFNAKFINKDELQNPDLFKKRILGLTSYFKSAQEKLLPKYDKDEDFSIIKSEMSEIQFKQYLNARERERKENENKKTDKETTSTYRIYSREFCNFVFPDDYPRPSKRKKDADVEVGDEFINEDEIIETKAISEENEPKYAEELNNALAYLKKNGDQYLSKDGLRLLSPKFLNLLNKIENPSNEGLHLVYSQFRTIEGVGVLKLILEQNGFVEFKLKKTGTKWDIEDTKEEDKDKPRFVLYTGTETSEEKEIIRNIYNSNWSQISGTIKAKLEKINANNFMGEIIKIFMITASGAEGINLENTRFVHIVEPYWHPVRMEQVIGRARRICSHKNLPAKLRNIKVFLYLATFSEDQKKNNKELSRLDDDKTTDEYLYNLSNNKEKTNNQILTAVKETAMDCFFYRDSGMKCFNFGTIDENKNDKNDFSTIPNEGEFTSKIKKK